MSTSTTILATSDMEMDTKAKGKRRHSPSVA